MTQNFVFFFYFFIFVEQAEKEELDLRTSTLRENFERKVREAANEADAWRAEYAHLAERCANLETQLTHRNLQQRGAARSVSKVDVVVVDDVPRRLVDDLDEIWQILGADDYDDELSGEFVNMADAGKKTSLLDR